MFFISEVMKFRGLCGIKAENDAAIITKLSDALAGFLIKSTFLKTL